MPPRRATARQGRARRHGEAPAEKVIDKVRRWFSLGRNGVYFNSVQPKQIWYWDFVRGEGRKVADLPYAVNLGMAVSPDERELCVTQAKSQNRDIMMIENFR